MATTLHLEHGKRALNEFPSHYHTGIDLIHHPPNDVRISDESLMEFGQNLQLSSSEITHMKNAAEKVLAHTVQGLPNKDAIEKIIMSECHLCNCGRNDCGLDIVVLMNSGQDVKQTTSHLKEQIHQMTSSAAGRGGMGQQAQQGFTRAGQAQQGMTGQGQQGMTGQGQQGQFGQGQQGMTGQAQQGITGQGQQGQFGQGQQGVTGQGQQGMTGQGQQGMGGQGQQGHSPDMLHFEYEDVHFNMAVGTRYANTEESNRVAIWQKIDQLDKQGHLKKVHLDQFAIDLYESTTMFIDRQVAPEREGALAGSEKFLQGAVRLSRAWRQCCLSSRDIQFAPLDAWLIMLNAVKQELDKNPEVQKGGSTVSSIGKRLKDLFKGGTETPKGLSMKNVMRHFFNDLANLEQVNICFNDVYDNSKIPGWIKTQRPLVLDPVNPYNNVVYNLHKRVNDDIKKHAAECIGLLDDPSATLPRLFHLPTYKKRGA